MRNIIIVETSRELEPFKLIPFQDQVEIVVSGKGSGPSLMQSFACNDDVNAIFVKETTDTPTRFDRWVKDLMSVYGRTVNDSMSNIIGATPNIETAAKDPSWVEKLQEMIVVE